VDPAHGSALIDRLDPDLKWPTKKDVVDPAHGSALLDTNTVILSTWFLHLYSCQLSALRAVKERYVR
jgi:hypothetical protein